MKSPAISISNLTVSYRHRPVLRGIKADIHCGELTGIMGPNGAGKSTMLKAIIGLIACDTGRVLIFGKPGKKSRRRIAYIPQKEQIDWNFPVVVRDVVMMGRYQTLGWFKRASKKEHNLVDKALDEVGILEYATRQICLLSGGQQQRVFIARALVQQADIMFMDEPFVGVDALTQKTILALIEKLKGEGKAVVMINHDMSIVSQFDKLILINKQLIAIGSPAKVNTEKNIQRAYGGRMPMIEQAELSLLKAKK